MSSSSSFQNLTHKADFFDSSCRQLEKQLLPYLSQQNDTIVNLKRLNALFRNIGGTETNVELQECLYELGREQHTLSELDVFRICQEETCMMLDDAKTKLLQPVRDILHDYQQALVKYESISKGKSPQDIDPIYEERVTVAANTLPIHSTLFEKYRVKHMTAMLENVVLAELHYHCKAVEKLSPILQKLSTIKNSAI